MTFDPNLPKCWPDNEADNKLLQEVSAIAKSLDDNITVLGALGYANYADRLREILDDFKVVVESAAAAERSSR